MRADDFKCGYVPGYGREDLLLDTDIYAVVEHNSWGKPSEVLETSNDKEWLESRYTSDLYNDEGILDTVTSRFGIKPRYEVVFLSDILKEA